MHVSFIVRKVILLWGYGVLLSLSVIKKEKDSEDNKGKVFIIQASEVTEKGLAVWEQRLTDNALD